MTGAGVTSFPNRPEGRGAVLDPAGRDAQGVFGVTLGARERSTIVKVYHPLTDNVTAFFFLNRLANPFPELSALRPISGPLANRAVSGMKVGFGMRLRIGGGGEHASR